MGKRELQAVLDRSLSNLSQLCRDLGLALSTSSRWKNGVPGYAVFYAEAMAAMTPEQRQAVRERISLGRWLLEGEK
jgi:hypothetical protein